MTEDKLAYQVYKDGACVLSAPESCRYPKRIELDLMESGYVIRLKGKRVTKKEALLRTG